MSDSARNLRFTIGAVAFEGMLGVVGATIAAWQRIDWMGRLPATPIDLATTIGVGVIASLPPLCGLVWAMRSNWPAVVKLRAFVEAALGPWLQTAAPAALPALALAAGAGEEILFRGALQPWGAQAFGPATSWLAISLLFGALHSVSSVYFLFATCMGCYLGWLADRHGLGAAIAVHAIYDWIALVVLRRDVRRKAAGVGEDPGAGEDRASQAGPRET